jgi:predicted lipoprotein with Yx(FWY)xxD motif
MQRILIGAALAFVVAACGGPGGSPAPGSGSPSATGTAAASGSPSSTGSPAGDGATVELAESELGEILVDAEGLTLYGFVPDQVAGGVPTCYEDCAANWPALEADDDFTVGEGLDETMFTVVERTDGATQLAIGDYPLYYFANDAAPGDVNGQGLGENWFVVGADGELIE